MTPGEWKRIIRVAKAHGLNLFRFHSYCPPEAAFIAADELGFYFQVETGGAEVGDGKPVDRWIYEETDRILKAYGLFRDAQMEFFGRRKAKPEGRRPQAADEGAGETATTHGDDTVPA